MKKWLAWICTVCIALVCLSACKNIPNREDEVFFGEEILTAASLTDMPAPNLNGAVLEEGETLYCTLTYAEYRDYMKALLDYLFAREDIYYLSYPVGSGADLWFVTYDRVAPLKPDYDVTQDNRHEFVFSTTDTLGGNDGYRLINPVHIVVRRHDSPVALQYSDKTYNTSIYLMVDKPLGGASYDPCILEHTYGEETVYLVPGSDETCAISYCVHCGSKKITPFIGDMNGAYQVRIVGDSRNYFMPSCIYTEYYSGLLYELYTVLPYDNIVVTVNGTEIPATVVEYGGQERNRYAFIMPCADVEVVVTVLEDEPTDESTDEPTPPSDL